MKTRNSILLDILTSVAVALISVILGQYTNIYHLVDSSLGLLIISADGTTMMKMMLGGRLFILYVI